MTDLETYLAITCVVLAFCWYREHDKRTNAERFIRLFHMLMKKVGMGHATVVKIGDDEFTIRPTEAGIKAAFEEITLP